MLGLKDRLDGFACFFVDIIQVKDSSFSPFCKVSHGAPDVSMKDLLMKGFGPLLGHRIPLLGSQVSFHGS
jgi:hypothetical protein